MTGTEGSFEYAMVTIAILIGVLVVMLAVVTIRGEVKKDRKAKARERRGGLGAYYRQLDQINWDLACEEMRKTGIVTIDMGTDLPGFHLWPDDQIPLKAQALLCAGFLHKKAVGQVDWIGKQVAREVMRVVPQDQQESFVKAVRARHEDAGDLLNQLIVQEEDRARDQQRTEDEIYLLADGTELMQQLTAEGTRK